MKLVNRSLTKNGEGHLKLIAEDGRIPGAFLWCCVQKVRVGV